MSNIAETLLELSIQTAEKRTKTENQLSKVFVTNHGQRRARKRGNIPYNKQKEMMQRALKYGLRLEDTSGDLNTWIGNRKMRYSNQLRRIYGHNLYIMSARLELITVLDIPKEFIPEVEKLEALKRKLVDSGQYIQNYGD